MQPPPLPSSATIRYNLTRHDLFRVRLRSTLHNRVLQIMFPAMALLIAWQNFASPEFKAGTPFLVKLIASCLVAAFCVAAGFVGMFAVIIAGLFMKNRGILGDHEIQLTEAGLIERTEANEGLHRWPAFHKMFVAGNYLYLYVTDTQVHAIPLRSFPTPDHLATFQQQIQNHLTAAKKPTTA